jgi:hypothetical protein
MSEGKLSLTKDDLKEILTEVIAEVKKPNEVEQQKIDQQMRQIEQDQKTRLETRDQKLDAIAAKRQFQKTCLHEGGRPIHPHTVFVQDDWGGYILCQVCQIVVRPADSKAKTTECVYDTELFNRLFQKTSSSGIFA